MSPGMKRGGWVNVVQHTVSVSCPGDAVLPNIEVRGCQLAMLPWWRSAQVGPAADRVHSQVLMLDVQIDVSGMDLGDKLTLGALAARLPAGTHTLLAKDMRHPVVRIGGKGNR